MESINFSFMKKNVLNYLLYLGLFCMYASHIRSWGRGRNKPRSTNLFKYGFERLRPCHNQEIADIMRIVKKGCGGLYGYFSGHASNSFALSTYFSLLFANRYPKLKFALFFMASLVAYSRIYIGVHYPLDVISGALFGTLWSLSFFYVSLKFSYRFFPKVSLEL